MPEGLSVRRAWDATLNWVDDHDLTQVLSGLAFVLVCATVVLLIVIVAPFDPEPTHPSPPPPAEGETPPASGPTEHVNLAGGFGFNVPATWDLREQGSRSLLESANGRIDMTFGPGSRGRAPRASARLLDSLLDTLSHQHLIGETWTRIAGARSLLVSGTASDETGRRVRFLAITVPWRSGNFAISIRVPATSDPALVLPRLEEIVTSFEILE